VRGDIIVLSEGDRVPADALLWQCQDLQADESLLTGESVPVRKLARATTVSDAPARPGGDDLPQVFSGALIVRGTGVAEVTATGARSEIGKIGQSLSTLEPELPRLQVQTQRLVRLFALVGGAVSVLAVVLYRLLRGGWLDAVLAGIALGMSMLPEEFPVVLTVFMAMGAWRISRARVLTRRAISHRNARLGDRSLHRQDGHIDREPHVDRRIAAPRRQRVCGKGFRRPTPRRLS
jgi:Ca2+-transporting ATPase